MNENSRYHPHGFDFVMIVTLYGMKKMEDGNAVDEALQQVRSNARGLCSNNYDTFYTITTR